MNCTLSKMKTYDAGRIVHDNGTGTYTVQLVDAPKTCADGVFTSKKAKVQVVGGLNAQLTFDMASNRPLLLVPSSNYVQEVGSSDTGVGTVVIVLLAAFAVLFGIFALFRRETETIATTSGGPYRQNGNFSHVPYRSSVATLGNTTVVNNNSNDGLLTGMMLGEMMSNNQRVVERDTTIIERDSYNSTTGDNYSSDSDSSSYSSDDSSSYSSDDSSSYSSDDSSSFSSDSSDSGSFGSDS